jgi:hypothetical protein
MAARDARSPDALRRYLDRRLSGLFAPSVALLPPSPLAEPDDPQLWIKPAFDATPDDPMAAIAGANPRTGDAVIVFTDGDPAPMGSVLLACLGAQEFADVMHVGHVARLQGSAYLHAHGLDAALFLAPAALKYSAKVAHRPRGALAGWRIFLIVPITEDEFRMGRQDPDLLFAHFDAVGRDLMTVRAPYRIPAAE